MVLRWYTLGSTVLLLAAVGCEGQQRDFEEMPGTTQTTSPAPPAAEVPTTTGARRLPSALEKAEDAAEDVQEDIREADWDDATEETRKLQSLSASIRQAGVPEAQVSAYDSAVMMLAENVQRRDQVGAGVAANSVERAVLRMMAEYQLEVPVEVRHMAVENRDVVYRAAAGEWGEAEKAVERLRSNYDKVAAQVAQRDANLDARVRSAIEQLDAAVKQRDGNAISATSDRVRNELKAVEGAF